MNVSRTNCFSIELARIRISNALTSTQHCFKLRSAAGESLGMDRHLKSNTVKTRTHSLFRQGCLLYDLIPNMPEHRLRPLAERYANILEQSRVVTETFAIV